MPGPFVEQEVLDRIKSEIEAECKLRPLLRVPGGPNAVFIKYLRDGLVVQASPNFAAVMIARSDAGLASDDDITEGWFRKHLDSAYATGAYPSRYSSQIKW